MRRDSECPRKEVAEDAARGGKAAPAWSNAASAALKSPEIKQRGRLGTHPSSNRDSSKSLKTLEPKSPGTKLQNISV